MDAAFLKAAVRGEVREDEPTLRAGSTDASIFSVKPAAVFVPEDADDLAAAVRAVSERARDGETVSLTARAAGTCMSGGSLTESVQVDCRKLAAIAYDGAGAVTAGPGTYLRDVQALAGRHGYFFPSYPASWQLCAVGGVVANNAGGEKNLRYGKTNRYVAALDVILDDGSRATFRKLDAGELAGKLALESREGEVYRGIHAMLAGNRDLLRDSRPKVTKNSSGYALWDVWDEKAGTFDLTQLVTGSQGTLCLIAEATLRLERPAAHASLTVIYLEGTAGLAALVRKLLAFGPESLESFDHHTLRLALRYLPALARHLGIGVIGTVLRFVPDLVSAGLRGLPPLVVLAELTSDDAEELHEREAGMHASLREAGLRFKVAGSGPEAQKYWAVRRESFTLLRERTRDRVTAPFIDDIVVRAEDLSEFLPQLERLMERYQKLMTYTIAGHVGDGNFHIIPLINLHDPEARAAMYELQEEALTLTLAFGGSTSGEHNDGLIRTRYVERQFGAEMNGLFERTKDLFDPQGMFNPGKKVRGDWAFAQAHVK